MEIALLIGVGGAVWCASRVMGAGMATWRRDRQARGKGQTTAMLKGVAASEIRRQVRTAGARHGRAANKPPPEVQACATDDCARPAWKTPRGSHRADPGAPCLCRQCWNMDLWANDKAFAKAGERRARRDERSDEGEAPRRAWWRGPSDRPDEEDES